MEFRTATPAEMSGILGISRASLDKRRCVDPANHPPYYHLGRSVRYILTGPRSYETWLAARIQGGGTRAQ
jgi:predicted DNA-binding transcriptional regulator AlpA